jgi:DNA-binding response OmpR family regulator
MKARILWIEGKRAESPPFVQGLRKKGYIVESVSSGGEALNLLPDFDPDLVVVNAASMRTSGKRICGSIRRKAAGVPILLTCEADDVNPGEGIADAVVAMPFTPRKLFNRIKQLLPGDGENILHVGPIRLDQGRKRVRCLGHEATLTPRLTQLLKELMQHPGVVLERQHLFKNVWNTDYTGDTRTLDVHISWLRQAIEEDPRKPRFLITIRGVGYRLDV